MANQPITVAKATQLMQEYVSYMTNHGINMNQQTQMVAFDSGILSQWMSTTQPSCDEFRICLGVYPPNDANAGHITVAIWPYKNGQPAIDPNTRLEIEPFNEGQLYP